MRRYNEVAKLLGEPPSWLHFLDPESGDLLHLNELKKEKPEERSERVAKLARLILGRRDLTREASVFGFLRRLTSIVHK